MGGVIREGIFMLPTFTHQIITPMMRTHFADSASTAISTQTEPLTGGTGEGLGLYRVSGKARVQNREVDWSFVLKVIRPTAGGATITDWNYWRREAHVYESILPATLHAAMVCKIRRMAVVGFGWRIWAAPPKMHGPRKRTGRLRITSANSMAII